MTPTQRIVLGWVPAILWFALIFVLSSQPSLPSPSHISDKQAHAFTYGVLARALPDGADRLALAPRRRRESRSPPSSSRCCMASPTNSTSRSCPAGHRTWPTSLADAVGAALALTAAWGWAILVGRRSSIAALLTRRTAAAVPASRPEASTTRFSESRFRRIPDSDSDSRRRDSRLPTPDHERPAPGPVGHGCGARADDHASRETERAEPRDPGRPARAPRRACRRSGAARADHHRRGPEGVHRRGRHHGVRGPDAGRGDAVCPAGPGRARPSRVTAGADDRGHQRLCARRRLRTRAGLHVPADGRHGAHRAARDLARASSPASAAPSASPGPSAASRRSN